jgi:hypothetical protein
LTKGSNSMCSKKSLPPAKAKSRDLAAFKAMHDPSVIIPNKIRAALKALGIEGRESFAYEQSDPHGGVPMVKRANVSTTYLSQYRKQFADHVVKVPQAVGARSGPKFVWFADPKVAAEARGGPVDLSVFDVA